MSHDHPHSEAAHAVHEGRPFDAQYVRGARPGRRVLWILIVSGGAAAILLLGLWLLSNSGFAAQNPDAGEQAVNAATFADPPQGPEASAPAR